MKKGHEEQAQRLDQIALELEKAAAHARTAARHFRAEEIPRACAHALASEGHLHAAMDTLSELAMRHAIVAIP